MFTGGINMVIKNIKKYVGSKCCRHYSKITEKCDLVGKIPNAGIRDKCGCIKNNGKKCNIN